MRRTGSRESRERREASATSPTSIAVNTFSIRFGSRRIQRPSHQKIRSSTTARATMETTRIGHIIGPPLRKFSTKKFLAKSLCGVPAGLALAEALGLLVVVVVVAGDVAAVAGVIPGAGERPGTVADAPGAVVVVVVVVAGDVTGAVAGLMAGLRAVVGGTPGGLLAG